MRDHDSIIIGTRGSRLATAQTTWVRDRLAKAAPGLRLETQTISTKGDRLRDVPFARIEGKGVFTRELEVALLDGRVDLVVHSMKDLPTELPSGLVIGAVPPREDPHDAIVSRGGGALAVLPEGVRVGTSSLRRKAQLLALRPDLDVVPIRGNVDTRLRKLAEGQCEAIVLARAGLVRLNRDSRSCATLPFDVMVPAAGQGALAIEVRAGDGRIADTIEALHCPQTAACVTAERAMLMRLGGGCHVPVGGIAETDGARIQLRGVVCSVDGRTVYRAQTSGPISNAEQTGYDAAGELIEQGAGKLLGTPH